MYVIWVAVAVAVLVLGGATVLFARWRRTRALFDHYCKMTCINGSECGACPCARPTDCQLRDHPRFPEFSGDAIDRMREQVIRQVFRTGKAVVGTYDKGKVMMRTVGEE